MPEENLQIAIPESLENLKLPDPNLVEYYEDEKNRRYWITGQIDESSLFITKAILKANIEDKDVPVEQRKPVKIFINSPGGLLVPTMSIVGLIRISKTPIWTINVSECYSAAGIILMSGHKRFALPYSICLIHSGSGGAQGTFEQSEQQMKQYKELVKSMKDFILTHTIIDAKTLNKKISLDWYINTNEMLGLGIVDELVTDIDVLF